MVWWDFKTFSVFIFNLSVKDFVTLLCCVVSGCKFRIGDPQNLTARVTSNNLSPKCFLWQRKLRILTIAKLPLTEVTLPSAFSLCCIYWVFHCPVEKFLERKMWACKYACSGCACQWVLVAWTCSANVNESWSLPVLWKDVLILFSCQTSQSSLKLDVQKWFYFSIEWQVSNLLDAIGNNNPVIFTVVNNTVWGHCYMKFKNNIGNILPFC